MLRKVPDKVALVELPQTRTEVVAIDAHADQQALVHLTENLRESVYLAFQNKEDVEGVHIRRSVLAGERSELRYPFFCESRLLRDARAIGRYVC